LKVSFFVAPGLKGGRGFAIHEGGLLLLFLSIILAAFFYSGVGCSLGVSLFARPLCLS
jgi:hypothetical protein